MAVPAWTRPGVMRAWLLATTALLPMASAFGQTIAPSTLPAGGQVSAGRATISQSGTAMQVRQGTDRATINWQRFDIGANASVNFQQPSASSWTLNRVTGSDPSVIAGRMTANGGVAVVNQSGVVFVGGAQVNVGSLIASAAGITDQNFMAGRMQFDAAPRPGAKVENRGSITIADRGLAALVGPRVANSGTIRARLGRVALQGAETYSLDLAGDGLLSIDVTQAVRTSTGGAAALVTNSGVIEAPGGAVLLSAHAASGLVEDLVRNTGRISADTAAGRTGQVALRAEGGSVQVAGTVTAAGNATERGGRIEARGSSATTVAGAARIDASGGTGGGAVLLGTTGVGRGQRMSARTVVEAGARIRADATLRGDGGTIAVNSRSQTIAQGKLSARGGAQGGNGGMVELSGQGSLAIAAQVDLAAPAGQAGTLLLDPQNIAVVADADMPADTAAAVLAAGPDSDANGSPANTVVAGSGAGGSVLFIRASDLNAFSAGTVTLQATHNIDIQAAVSAQTVRLFADGSISESGTGTITADTLVIRAFNGSDAAGTVTLNLANAVGILDAKVTTALSFNNGSTDFVVANATGATVTLQTTGALSLQGIIGASGADLRLRVDGAVTQTAGRITAGRLTIGNAAGTGDASSIALDAAAATNGVATLDARAATGLTFTNNGSMTVARATGPAVTLTAAGGAMHLTGAVGGAGAAVTLAADTDLTQSATGIITAGSLTADVRGGSLTLGAGNLVSRLTTTGSVPGGFTFVSATDLSVGHVETAGSAAITGKSITLGIGPSGNAVLADAVALTATSGAIIQDPASRIANHAGTGRATLTASATAASPAEGSIALLGTTNGIGPLIATATGAVSISATGDMAVLRAEGTSVSLIAGERLTVVGSASGGLGIQASGDIALTASQLVLDAVTGTNGDAVVRSTGGAGVISLRSDTLNWNGKLDATTSGAIEMGPRTAGTAVELGGTMSSAGALSVNPADFTAATLVTGTFRVGETTIGAETMRGQTLTVTSAVQPAATAVSRRLELVAATALTVRDAIGRPDLAMVIRASGALTQTTASVLNADVLTVRGAGGIAGAGSAALATAANAVATLDALTEGDLAFRNIGAVTVDQARITGSGHALLLAGGGTMTLAGVLGGNGNTATLRSNGNIVQSGGAISALTLTVRDLAGDNISIGAVTLSQSGNRIGILDAAAGARLAVDNGNSDLTVARATATSSVILRTTGALTLDGPVGGTAATVVALLTDGAIVESGGVLAANALTVRGAAGGSTAASSLALGHNNAVATLDANVAGDFSFVNDAIGLVVAQASSTGMNARITIASGGSLLLNGVIGGSGAAVSLDARGGISQTVTGQITAAKLQVTATGGAVALAAAPNAIDLVTVTVRGDGNGVAIRSIGALTVGADGITAGAGASIRLAAQSLMLGGPLGFGAPDATNLVVLNAMAGGIGQDSNGAIVTRLLSINAADGIALAAAGNAFTNLMALSTGGGIDVHSSTSFIVATGGIHAGAGTTITLAAPGITIDDTIGFVGDHAGNRINLAADGLVAAAAVDAGGSGQVRISPASATAVELGAATVSGALQLSAETLANIVADRLRIITAGSNDIAVNGRLDLAARLGTLELTAGGAITQGTAGTLVLRRLAANAGTGSITLSSNGNSVAEIVGTTDDTTIGLRAGRGITLTSSGLLSLKAAAVAGGGEAITLTADSLVTTAALRFGADHGVNRITLTADAIRLGGSVSAGSGQVALHPRSGDHPVELSGTTISGALQISAASLAQITASRLDITTSGAGSITVSGAVSFRDAAVDAASGIGGVRVGTLALAGADIRDTASGALNVGALLTTASASIDLSLGSHAVDTFMAQAARAILFNSNRNLLVVSAGAAGGARADTVTLQAPMLTLTGDTHGGLVALTAAAAGAAISQASGAILDAGNLLLRTNGGDAILANSSNQIDWLSFADLRQAAANPVVAGTLRLVSAHDLGLGRHGGAGITAGSIDITVSDPGKGIVARDPANEIVLQAIGSSGASGRLALTANSMDLSPAGTGTIGNSIISASGGTVMLLPLTMTRGIQIAGPASGTTLRLAGDALSVILADRLVLGRNGGGAIEIAGMVTLPGVTVLELLSGDSITQQAGATLAVSALTATAGTSASNHIRLDQANAVGTITVSTADTTHGLSAGGDISLRSTNALLTIDAAVMAGAGRSITLRAPDLALNAALAATGGASLGLVELLPEAGSVRLGVGQGVSDPAALYLHTDEIGRIKAGTGRLRIGGTAVMTTATDLVVAGDILLRSGGAAVLDLRAAEVMQTGGLVSVTALTGQAATGFALNVATNQIDELGLAGAGYTTAIATTAGSISITTARALTVRGDVLAAGIAGSGTAGVILHGAESVLIGDDTAPMKAVRVEATRGDVVIRAEGLLTLRAQATIRAGDPSSLAAEGSGADSFGNIALHANALVLAGTLDAGRGSQGRDVILTTAGGSINADGAVVTARRDTSATAANGIVVAASTTVSTGRDLTLKAMAGEVSNNGFLTTVASSGTAASITLTAAGDVTNGASGVITGGTVAISAGVLVRNQRRIEGTEIQVTGGAGVRAEAGSSMLAGAALTIAAPQGGIFADAATLRAGTSLVLTTAGGAVTLSGATVMAGAALHLTAGGGLTATGATLTSSGGSIELRTGHDDIVLTTTSVMANTDLVLFAGTEQGWGGNVTLTGGRITAHEAITMTAERASLAGSPGTISLHDAAVSADAALTLTAGGSINQDGGLISAGTRLGLLSGSDITQSAGGRILAPMLAGVAAGSVRLINGADPTTGLAARSDGNSIADIAGIAAGGDVFLASTVAPLRISGPITAGSGRTLRLFADDLSLVAELAAPGGSITLSPYTRDGSVALVLGGESGASAANTITLDSAEIDLLPSGAATNLRFGRTDNPDGGTDIASITIAGRVDLADPASGTDAAVTRLELNSRAGIVELADARLVVPILAATAGGSINLDPGTSGNRIETLAGIVAAGSFTLRNSAPSLLIGRGSADSADAGSGAEAINVGSGRTVTLRVQDLVLTDVIRAPGGTIEILPDAMGRGMSLGGTIAGTLSLSTDELRLLGARDDAAQVLRLGGHGPAGGGAVTAGDIRVVGAVELQDPIVRVRTLELLSVGSVIGSGGAITVPALRATVAGDVILDHADNRFLVNAIASSGSGRSIAIRQAGDLRLANAVGAIGGLDAAGGITAIDGTVWLVAGGSIGQDSGAIISTGTLRLAARAPVTLDQANAFANLADASILGGGSSGIRGTGYTVTGPVNVGGMLTLMADTDLAVTGSVSTTGTLAMKTSFGTMTLNGATISGGSDVTLQAATVGTNGGSVIIIGANVAANGNLSVLAGDAAQSGHLAITGSMLRADGSIGITAGRTIGITASTLDAGSQLSVVASAGDMLIDSSSMRAVADLHLQAQVGRVIQRRGNVTGTAAIRYEALEDIIIAADGGVAPVVSALGQDVMLSTTTGEVVLEGTVLTAARGLVVDAGRIQVTGSSLTAGTNIQFGASVGGAQAGSITIAGTALTAGQDVNLFGTGSLTIDRSHVMADGQLTLDAGNGITINASSLDAGIGLTVTARHGDTTVADGTLSTNGALTLAASAGAITQTRGSISSGGDMTLHAFTDVMVADAGSGNLPTLRSHGTMVMQAIGGRVLLQHATASGGTTFSLQAADSVTLANANLSTAGRLGVAAGGSLDIQGSTLFSAAGDLNLTAGGAGSLTASSLVASAAAGQVRIVTGGALHLARLTLQADVADFEAGRLVPADPSAYSLVDAAGVLTMDGIAASIGSGILFAGPGGITESGTTFVASRGTALPAVLYDTRLTPGRNPLAVAQPDVLGLNADQQATQVRSEPGAQSPGSFGPANQMGPAGNLVLNLDAGRSAVFLLVDDGGVRGNILAGRLGVHGAGGTMSLFGTLNGTGGAGAARFADITRPIEAHRLQGYRINGCVVGSVNCVVTPSIQLLPPRPSDRAAFVIEGNRINTSEVLIPNIAEEDDE